MPNWNEVLGEIATLHSTRRDALDVVRRKYLQALYQKNDRNIIAYYSGWLQKPNQARAIISDEDKNGFMNAIHGMDRTKGLDLILHTPGGDLAATESIVNYLRCMFGTDIRAIIPQLAMSAGTMIACACKEIIMGKESNIGPIDPQFGGIPAYGVISEFEEALEEIQKNPATIPIWQVIVGKYHPTFIGECRNAIELSTEIVTDWLKTGMFKGLTKDEVINNIVSVLGDHGETKTHARHIHFEEAEKIGLKIVRLEKDSELQDVVLTIHHAYMHTFGNSPAIKIIENHNGNAIISAIDFIPQSNSGPVNNFV